MKYNYHCQHQAESFAKTIIPVPSDYPLKAGLKDEYRTHFTKLCELAKDIYVDMAKKPEEYGLMLLDIHSKDHNLARDSYRTVHRFVDVLNVLFLYGEVKNHRLHVDTKLFCKNAISKYALILSKLQDFGFIVSSIDKKAPTFTVEYPDDSDMIDTIKVYCDSWKFLDQHRDRNNELVKINSSGFHHRFYRFDYRITADLQKIPMLTWVEDEADGAGYSTEIKAFSLAFYQYSLKYEKVTYNGDYHFKSKRIARITNLTFVALGELDLRLSLKLPKIDKYIDKISTMPEKIRNYFTKNYCNNCTGVRDKKGECKYRINWTYENQKHEGCSHWCFAFNDFDVNLVEHYWRLLEMEYGI